MGGELREYRRKRDFDATPEPPAERREHGGEEPRFVIQQHDATHLHWDLRLEHEGVLLSWALPKGIPQHPKSNRLAVRTEDHPLEYLDFEGEIPEGQYGAGTMKVWDRGRYEPHKLRDDEVIVTLHGERAAGRYALFQTKDRNWMIHRVDPPAEAGREPAPGDLLPMLACPGELPREPELYAYEIKWDGVRVIATVEGGHVKAVSRNGNDVSARYPELRAMARSLGALEVVLDGEVVAFGESGAPSFERLQSRMHLGSDSAVRRAVREIPVTFAIFDLLWLDGRSLMPLAYADRRRLLDELDLNGPRWRTPAAHDNGPALLEAARREGLEGIVAKRRDSTYEPGRRSSAWIKVKNRMRQEFVVAGWTPGEGSRSRSLGSLLVGYHRDGELVLAGSVGSGFSDAALADLSRRLTELERSDAPFGNRKAPKGSRYCEPRLVAEVEFAEWTRAGTLRAPVFKGLRDDVDAEQVVREGA